MIRSNDIKIMKTNEENRNKADRRIPLTESDCFFELLGNMSGEEQHLYINYDNNYDCFLYTYHNDQGFTPQDKEAIKVKNMSGDNSNTVGHNGHGLKLAIDNLLPEDTDELLPYKNVATIYSINDKSKFFMGHFNYKDWEPFNYDELDDIISKMKIKPITGSLFKIPLNEGFASNFHKNETELLNHCLKFLNIKIARKEVAFYWNGEKKDVDEICPSEGSITINYTLGYDMKARSNKNHRKPLLLRTDNYSELDEKAKIILEEYIDISKQRLTKYGIFDHSFIPEECGKLVLNIVEKHKDDIFNQDWVDGCLPYINNTCIAYKAITKGFPFQHGVDQKMYGGKPRFVNHIPKVTILYSIPADKAHIKPTAKGLHMNKFINQIAKKYFNSVNVYPLREVCVEKRKTFTETQKSRAERQYQENKKYIYKNPVETRFICCNRFMLRNQVHAGHIQSHHNGGNTNNDNLLLICNRCNNNDIRDIPNMMVEEWGIDDPNTKRVENYLKLTKKNLSNVIPELREIALRKRELNEESFNLRNDLALDC